MNRTLVGGLALAFCMLLAPAVATAGQRSLPMHFAWQQEGPAKICGNKCRTWISAVGTITADTPEAFQAFVQTRNANGALLALDSGGGSVHGAIALGREIRKLNMTTTVGRTVVVSGSGDGAMPRATLSPRADCESMCAFVLIAGVKRIVPPQARVMVHQIWLGDRRDDAAAATYTADDVVLVQRDIGRLVLYTAEMGGSPDLLEMSLRIPPWEPMHVLSRAEIESMHVETVPDSAPTTASAVASAAVASLPSATNGSRRDPDTAQGWLIGEQDGRAVVTRRHPLTVEGVEIGNFDLELACGATPDDFAISYSEHRGGGSGIMTPLTSVALSLDRRSEQLKLVASASQSAQLKSLARGAIPKALIDWFSQSDGRALVVSTTNAKDAHTEIRVGNSGLAAELIKLKKACNTGSKQAQLLPSARH